MSVGKSSEQRQEGSSEQAASPEPGTTLGVSAPWQSERASKREGRAQEPRQGLLRESYLSFAAEQRRENRSQPHIPAQREKGNWSPTREQSVRRHRFTPQDRSSG